MEEWKEYKIGDLCSKICSGGTPSSKNAEYYDGDIPWLNTKEINFNRIYSTEKCISEEGLNNSSAKWIEENSVIVAMYGATAGKTAITKIPLTTNQACCNLTINPSIADYRFVYYYLCYKFVELASLANGGAQQNLNAQIIRDFDILLPSLQKQEEIANILSSLDDKIEVNRRINDNLEQQAQALFKSWFVDFEPFKDGEFVESELGMIPKGWKTLCLRDIVEVSKKSVNPSKFPDILFVHFSIPAFDNDMKPELQLGKDILSNKFTVMDKMTLFSKLNPRIKRVWYIDDVKDNSICSTEFVPYRAKDVLLSSYVFSLINSNGFYDYVMSLVNGATGSHQRFHPDETLSYLIPFNNEVVLNYSKIVEPILKTILKNRAESSRLSSLRDTLLPRLMSGELRINDISV